MGSRPSLGSRHATPGGASHEPPRRGLGGPRLPGRTGATVPTPRASRREGAARGSDRAAVDVRGDVEQRGGEQTPLDQQERDEQPPESTIAVKEGVDRPELVVDRSDAQEWRQVGVGMEVLLEGVQAHRHQFRCRRHVGRRVDDSTWRTDPVLRASKLARCGVATTDTVHEDGVRFLEQWEAQRQASLGVEDEVGGPDVVATSRTSSRLDLRTAPPRRAQAPTRSPGSLRSGWRVPPRV